MDNLTMLQVVLDEIIRDEVTKQVSGKHLKKLRKIKLVQPKPQQQGTIITPKQSKAQKKRKILINSKLIFRLFSVACIKRLNKHVKHRVALHKY